MRGTRIRRGPLQISGKGLIAVLAWGASFVATRVGLESFTPLGLVAVRTWAGALLLAGVLLSTHRSRLPARRDWPACVVLGVVLALHLFLQALGLTMTTAVHTAWIIGFIPVMVALGAHWVGQQRLPRAGWAGVAVGAAGILLVMSSTPRVAGGRALHGDLLQVASCLTWTVYTLVASRPLARSGALRVTTAVMAIAAVLVTAGGVSGGTQIAPLTPRVVVAMLFLGPVCSGLAYYLWFAAQREHGPARVGTLIYLEPFVGLATGMLLLGERVTLAAIVGGLAVLLGVWLVNHVGRRPVALAPD